MSYHEYLFQFVSRSLTDCTAEVQLGVSTVSRVTAHQCIKLKCDTAAVPRHSRTPGNGRGGQVTIRTDFEENLKKARSQSGQN
ncbi:uncharacterized protein LACBIDRAFT_304478 [Laccaria bicolor S238N-H82]|uniref:Predicted protein n=1 Tax=Laccaria bicolor (strain S238N-H82 / ATCC MYA-4686) TaxID=486041 RepID=B0DLQ0_LACBS|nr:uncharacterized protein LACBIDRAFT_304478 [Laccaria bicolor S238N-H82]EDR04429.1 predicted protein [Laccaria bicolor S238N-H82]|eukprot:XP_001884948.1 predicted protein [Laccaria bicolor S238N-H82]